MEDVEKNFDVVSAAAFCADVDDITKPAEGAGETPEFELGRDADAFAELDDIVIALCDGGQIGDGRGGGLQAGGWGGDVIATGFGDEGHVGFHAFHAGGARDSSSMIHSAKPMVLGICRPLSLRDFLTSVRDLPDCLCLSSSRTQGSMA